MKNNKFSLALLGLGFTLSAQLSGTGQLNGGNRPITTAVPFVNINPDPRAGGMGDAGVATSSTSADMYWNIGKLAFNENKMGAQISVNPWLRSIVNDMYLNNLSAHYKRRKEEAFGFSMTYFDLGKIEFRNDQNQSTGNFNPREFSFNGGYSRKLSQKLGLGLALKFIHSNLTGGYSSTPGESVRALNTAAVDMGVFYTTPVKTKLGEDKLNFGANISNIGGKVKYVSSGNSSVKDFLPMNLRLGTAYTHEIDMYNKITVALDFNKLLTPSPQIIKSTTGADSALVYPNKGLISGLFGSFSDAPGGFKEEIQEVTTSLGLEYSYNNLFMARAGYFNESKYKGSRKFLTVGFGLKIQDLGFDFAYLVNTASKGSNALGGTLRFLVSYNIKGETSNSPAKDGSVTD
jgi:hypothetical protein